MFFMKLESDGILISLRPFDEVNAVAIIFSREYGIMSGMMRGALVATKNKPLVGQVGSVSWNARLDSAMGVFHWESEKNLAVPLMANAESLSFMNAAFDLIANLLPERESYEKLYDATLVLLKGLTGTVDTKKYYLDWEVCLLSELGYALDFTRCSGCGRHENLNFLSPRTGRAVCDDCAAPYVSRLYRLPVDLETTYKFLENICVTQGVKMPQFRAILKTKKNLN